MITWTNKRLWATTTAPASATAASEPAKHIQRCVTPVGIHQVVWPRQGLNQVLAQHGSAIALISKGDVGWDHLPHATTPDWPHVLVAVTSASGVITTAAPLGHHRRISVKPLLVRRRRSVWVPIAVLHVTCSKGASRILRLSICVKKISASQNPRTLGSN